MAMIVNQIKLLRSRMGLTQEQVAEAVGVSRQAVAKWEKGDTLPDIESCIRLADLFRVPLDALVRGIKENGDSADGQKMFGCVRMNEKGQITLPAQVREVFGLKPGNMILVLADTEKGIALVNMCGPEENMVFPVGSHTEGKEQREE